MLFKQEASEKSHFVKYFLYISEKIGVIEQLKVKSHELTNLSQSLNDQLVELQQQLTDRTHMFSSDSSDDSDVTDFMSDDLSRDSWFDSAASNFSADNVDTVDNANNDANQDNSNNGNNEGSDVVERVERTVVNSLFELSSRLERVRNQMRAVLNSRLVQDQNNLNDEVRIPSAALDAIVNSSNNDDNNHIRVPASTSAIVSESHDNCDNTSYHSSNEAADADNNASDNNDGMYLTDDDNHSYADQSYDRYSNVTESQWGSFTDEGLPTNIPSDLNWISGSDSNQTPHTRSPTPSPDCDTSDAHHSFASEATEEYSIKNRYVSEHIILAKPPDSPSDTTGSFSSICSTSSVANSRFGHDDDVEPVFSSPETNIAFSPPQRYFVSTGNNWRSPEQNSSPSSQRSSYSYKFTEESGIHIYSSLAHSIASHSSLSERHSVTFEDSHISNDRSNVSFISSIENSVHDIVDLEDRSDGDDTSHSFGSPVSCRTDTTDSEPDDVRNVHEHLSTETDGNRSGHCETSHSGSSLDYELEESFDEADTVDHLSETSAEGHHTEESDDYEDKTCSSNYKPLTSERGLKYDTEYSATKDEQVSRCEPDSTQSPSALQQQQSELESDEGANLSALISTATDSTDDTDESMKYLTKHRTHIEKSTAHSEPEDLMDMNSGNDFVDVHDDQERTAVTGENRGTETDFAMDHLDRCVNGSEIPNITSDQKEHKKFRKRKQDNDAFVSWECKRKRSNAVPSRSGNDQSHLTSQQFDPKDTVDVLSDKDYSNSTSVPRYEFRKRSHESDNRSCNDSKKNKASSMISQHTNGHTYSQRSRKSPLRNRQARRQSHYNQQRWRIRPGANKRSNPPNVNNDIAGQSLNVKIDLSLINYSRCLGSDSSSTAIPTAAVVHSANMSPINTPASVRREASHAGSRQHVPDNSTKSSTPKPEDGPYRNSHRQRSSRSQRHDSQCSTRSINANTSPARAIGSIYNTSNRDFPNSWRDSSDSSSDNTWEPGSDCDDVDDTNTEGEDGFETDSSYEIQIPKSTAALLEEFASDESDESWTVGMN